MKQVEESLNSLIKDLAGLKELGGIDIFTQKTLELQLTKILNQVKEDMNYTDVRKIQT